MRLQPRAVRSRFDRAITLYSIPTRAYYFGMYDSCPLERRPLAPTTRSGWLVKHVSPVQSMRDSEPVRPFTAVGFLADHELCRGDEGDLFDVALNRQAMTWSVRHGFLAPATPVTPQPAGLW